MVTKDNSDTSRLEELSSRETSSNLMNFAVHLKHFLDPTHRDTKDPQLTSPTIVRTTAREQEQTYRNLGANQTNQYAFGYCALSI